MYKDIPGENKNTLNAKAEDFPHFSHSEGGEVFIYPRYNWWNDIVTIKSVDEATRTITFAKNCSYPTRPNDRYFIQNLLEELDSPGEWYLDSTNSTLYFWPPSPLEGKALVAPAIKTLLKLDRGASDVVIRGLSIECCSGTAVELKGTTNCLIAGCTLRNIGDINGSAIDIADGKNNGASGNDISEVGRHGISLSGGNKVTLEDAGNYAENNHIHHMGVYYKQGCGVSVAGCGNRVTHNLIHDGPRFAIQAYGTKHLVEYNHIHDVPWKPRIRGPSTPAGATGSGHAER